MPSRNPYGMRLLKRFELAVRNQENKESFDSEDWDAIEKEFIDAATAIRNHLEKRGPASSEFKLPNTEWDN